MTLRELVDVIRFDLDEKSLKTAMDRIDNFGKNASILLSVPIAALYGMSLKTSSNFEQMQISFETMLGSADKAKTLMEDMVKLSVTTPFQLQDISMQAKKLLAYGRPLNKIISDMTMLGNIATGTGAPLEQISLAFGQIFTKGRLMGQELLQLTNAGVPILDYLSKITGIAKKDLPKAIERGNISFDLVNQALIKMTSQGGLFFNLMIKQSQSLGGLWSNFLDSTALILNEWGMMLVNTFQLKKGIQFLIDTGYKLTKWLKSLTPFMRGVIVITVSLIALLGPMSFALMGFLAVIKSLLSLSSFISIFATLKSAVALLLTPQFLFIAASIIAAAAALFLFIEDIDTWIAGGDSLVGRLVGPWERYRDGLKLLWKGITGDMDALKLAFQKLIDETVRVINHFFDDTRVGKFIKFWSGLGLIESLAGTAGTVVGTLQTPVARNKFFNDQAKEFNELMGFKKPASTQSITIDSTINMQVPAGTQQQQIKAVEQAAKIAVRQELHRELKQVLNAGYGAEQ